MRIWLAAQPGDELCQGGSGALQTRVRVVDAIIRVARKRRKNFRAASGLLCVQIA